MNNLLTTTDRLITNCGPLVRLLDRIAERIIPHKTARACSCPYLCGTDWFGGKICADAAVDCTLGWPGTTWIC